MDEVRQLHNAAALSGNAVTESTRPLGTTRLEMRRMVDDVMRKLDLQPGMRVVELGAGTGVLGVPLSQRVGEYVGIDFSEQATAVLRHRLGGVGEVIVADLLLVDARALGLFDRVLMYATLHYVETDTQGQRLVDLALDLVTPAGRVLIGSIPLPRSDLPHTLPHKVASFGWRAVKKVRPVRHTTSAGVVQPLLPLSKALIESWLPTEASFRWLAPAIATPLEPVRADLIITGVRGAAR
jgi:cyclopropane fatty-acyl-phospholipid synthase-like methyltransferase